MGEVKHSGSLAFFSETLTKSPEVYPVHGDCWYADELDLVRGSKRSFFWDGILVEEGLGRVLY